MTTILTDNQHYTDIASAIRSKAGVQTTYLPSEMASAINAIPTGGGSDLGTKTITANGTYNASTDNLDGYSQVTVNVPSSGGRLPSGYTEVDYIEFTGNQYIYVDKTLAKKMVVHFIAKPLQTSEMAIIGANTSTSWELYTKTASYNFVKGYNLVNSLLNYNYDQDTYPCIGLFTYDGTYVNGFAIGCFYNASQQDYKFVGYIYEIAFVQWNQTTKKWDDFLRFIPCTRDSDSEPGFYETVDGVFYTNDGTGSLIAGAAV